MVLFDAFVVDLQECWFLVVDGSCLVIKHGCSWKSYTQGDLDALFKLPKYPVASFPPGLGSWIHRNEPRTPDAGGILSLPLLGAERRPQDVQPPMLCLWELPPIGGRSDVYGSEYGHPTCVKTWRAPK